MQEIIEVLWFSFLLFALWAAGTISEEYLSCPALIAEIVIGCILGPEVLNVVPEVDGISMVGLLGLLLIVLEGGLHIELSTLRKIGTKAFLIAISGTTLPVLFSLAVLPRFSAFSNIEGIIAGVSLSSTAIGMAAKLMQSLGLLKTHLGKLITCAAMIDDIASLVLLAIISNTVGDGRSTEAVVWAVALPLVSSVVFILCGTVLSFYMPHFVARIHRYVHKKADGDESDISGKTEIESVKLSKDISEQEEVRWDIILLILLLLCACMYTAIAHFVRTTYLLGAFFAGVSFSAVPSVVHTWDKHMSLASLWTGRLFFATIGFAIPVRELFSVEALYFGLLLSFIAIASKVVTGVYEWEYKWSVGWAMVGRGELGFVMAEKAYKSDLTSKLTFSVTVWALLVATVLSPLCFKKAVGSYGVHSDIVRAEKREGSMVNGSDLKSTQEKGYVMELGNGNTAAVGSSTV